jgi:hypothetical protein
MHIGLHHHRQQRPVDAAARLQQGREERPLAQLGDAQLDIAGFGRQQPRSGAVAVGGALLAPLIGPSADVLGGLGLDQRLEHQGEPFADDVQVTAGAQCIQQVGQGRLAEGHRGGLLGVHLGRNTLSFTRWPLALLLSKARLPSKSTTTWDAYVRRGQSPFCGVSWAGSSKAAGRPSVHPILVALTDRRDLRGCGIAQRSTVDL